MLVIKSSTKQFANCFQEDNEGSLFKLMKEVMWYATSLENENVKLVLYYSVQRNLHTQKNNNK